MKLLRKTGLYYLLATVLMYTIGSLVFYQLLRYQLRNDTIEKIFADKARILKNVAQVDSANHILIADDAISFTPINADDTVVELLKDTDMLEVSDNEIDSYLQLQFKAKSRRAAYRVIFSKSLAERENLVRAVAYSFIFLMVIFVAGIFFINWYISEKVWGSFYSTIRQLRHFLVNSNSDITEFRQLEEVLQSMIQKMKSDYLNLKEFTENASHEIQTPLAAIRSRIELMLQSESLTENQGHHLAAINEAVNRLTRLNHSLLLLSKIENRQFDKTEATDIRAVLEQQIDNLRELIDARELGLVVELNGHPEIKIHPHLLEILISNLLLNAILHNVPNGFIQINLKEHLLTITNSGKELKISAQDLFNRFKKDNASSDSPGLGLSIVRKICETNNLRINYSYHNKVHMIRLHF
jgi:signal transduction histidine kinase